MNTQDALLELLQTKRMLNELVIVLQTAWWEIDKWFESSNFIPTVVNVDPAG